MSPRRVVLGILVALEVLLDVWRLFSLFGTSQLWSTTNKCSFCALLKVATNVETTKQAQPADFTCLAYHELKVSRGMNIQQACYETVWVGLLHETPGDISANISFQFSRPF